jgi:hypothetical protein
MKFKSISSAFLVLILCCSCTYEPYEHKLYVNERTDGIANHNAKSYLMASSTKSQENMVVGDILFRPFMNYSYVGSNYHGPYGLWLSFYSLSPNAKITVTSIKVKSSFSKIHHAIKEDALPIQVNLDVKLADIWYGETYLPKQMELDFDNRETIDVDFEMTGNSTKPVKRTYKFTPKLSKGLFQLID